MKLRDFLAIPFWCMALLFDKIAIHVGGVWTAEIYMESMKKVYESQFIK